MRILQRTRRLLARNLSHIRKWLLIGSFIAIGPAIIIYFRMPGKNPSHPPIITVSSQTVKALPLTVNVDENFNISCGISLHSLENQNWQQLNVNFPPGTRDISIGDIDGLTLDSVSNYLFKIYPEGNIQFNISKTTPDSLLRGKFKNNPFSREISFKLDNAIFSHSFSNKSLIIFYLCTTSGSVSSEKKVDVNLNTPQTLVLNSSIPSAERILPLGNLLNYDFQVNDSDSGLLFNFTDTSHAIFEEITLFIISSVFGFFSGLLIEHLLKNRT
ncbi:hypothetical protein [Pedobacter suwonensis]|uniref:hypothetical protein n=1 Tax=Pedobacter suwonensis TaxID=332999 RepID=UPI0011A99D2E|nr:hypothetical protein [Pedobacter suwonensis]